MRSVIKGEICPLRTEPGAFAPLADEALHGMTVEILERREGWAYVRTGYRYEGWAEENNLLTGEAAAEWENKPKAAVLHRHTCDVMAEAAFDAPILLTLPLGALVSPLEEEAEGWQEVELCDGRRGWVRGSVLGRHHSAPPFSDEGRLRELIVKNALRYVGTQYRWGGKTPLGIDCSGLASMAYLLSGIVIYRDARLKEGFPIHEIPLEKAKPGDLLYFPKHIAVYLGKGKYLHSTGKAGSDGVVFNSLNPDDPDFRADLRENLTAVGSYF